MDERRTVTMADVAARAGVSRALVSIVFRGVPGASPENRERVMRAAEELDYRPDHRARLLGSGRSRTIGVVFGLHQEFHADVVEHLHLAVDETGYHLALGAFAPSRGEQRALAGLLELRCEAVILVGSTMPRAEVAEIATHVPVIALTRALRVPGVDVVRTDDVAGARMAVDHLAGLGHRAIAHVDGGRQAGAAERRTGYRQAMRAHGLQAHLSTVAGGLTEEDGAAAYARLVCGAAPTAIVAFNDACGVGVMTAARAAGLRVPEGLSVVGYDDSPLARLSSISLTTVAQDARSIARSAVDLALRRIDEPDRDRVEVVVPPHLVVRATTAAAGR